MKRLSISAAIAGTGIALLVNAPLAAAHHEHTTDSKSLLMAKSNVESELADGEIKRVKKGSTKLTVKHGEITSLQMPPMTMEFEAKNEEMVSGLKRGDKIKFKAIEQDGKMVITHIEPASK